MNRSFTLVAVLIFAATVSCIKREIRYTAKSVVNADGSLVRSGTLVIAPADSLSGTQDSSEASDFYDGNFVPLDESRFEVKKSFSDSVLTITWSGKFGPDEYPATDYAHRVGDGPTAENTISVTVKNRWFFKDYDYREAFIDQVDMEKYYSLIDENLSRASDNILASAPMKGLRDSAGAESILSDLRKKSGSELLRSFMNNPRAADSLSGLNEKNYDIAGDSLSGLAGVKLSPDSAAALLKAGFGAVWDTLLDEHPEILGSYGLTEDKNLFAVEVQLPGCVRNGNADSTGGNSAFWKFDNYDFFGREKALEISARKWLWTNVIITVAVLAIMIILVLWPIRRKSMA